MAQRDSGSLARARAREHVAAAEHAFTGKAVALLLLGHTFRSVGDKPEGGLRKFCDGSTVSVAGQKEACSAYKKQVLEPLKAAGAEIEVLFTFPHCGSLHTELIRLFSKWLSPHVAAHKVADSRHMRHGWMIGYSLLGERMRARAVARLRPFDYILQARSDVMLDASILTWPRRGFVVPPSLVDRSIRNFDTHNWQRPPHVAPPNATAEGYAEEPASLPAVVSFDHVLFEQEGLECDGDNGCNYAGLLSARVATLSRWLDRPIKESCNHCVRDHLIWIPARHFPAINYTIFEARLWGHNIISYLLHSGLLPARQVGFMFPADCHDPAPFFTILQCLEGMAYRPLRIEYPQDWPPRNKSWPLGWRPSYEPPLHGESEEEHESWRVFAGLGRPPAPAQDRV